MPSRLTKPADQILEERRRKQTEYMRRYRKEHPDYIARNQLTAARNRLERAGYTVIPPEADA